MTQAPVGSICIANFNGEHLLVDCIDSILGQQDAPNTEIIVHDDASIDGSLQTLENYPGIKVIASQKKRGLLLRQ